MTKIRSIVFILVIIVAAGIFTHILSDIGMKTVFTSKNTYRQIDQVVKAPDFTLKSLEGEDVKLSNMFGQPLFITFFSIKSSTSIKALKNLSKADEILGAENLGTILAINYKDTNKNVEETLARSNIFLPILLDSDGKITELYGVESVPVTFIINRDGTLHNAIPGVVDKNMIISIVKELK